MLGKTLGKMIPLITEILANEKHFSQGRTPILIGASGEAHLLFKRKTDIYVTRPKYS
jgi:hypothetical protein